VRTELTERQREVLPLIAKGRTNGQIAEELDLSLDGVKWHVREILARLGVNSREEAAAWWKQNRSLRERMPGWLGWPFIAALGGTASVPAIAIVASSGILAGSDEQTGENTEKHRMKQPDLTLVADGEGWSVYVDQEGGVPHAEDAVLLVVSRWDQNRVSVVDAATGRIGMRVETLAGPMALLRESHNQLVISDGPLSVAPDSPGTERVLLFDLGNMPALAAEGWISERFDYRSPGDGRWMTLSNDERLLYWRQYGGGQGGTIRGLNLDTMTDSGAAFEALGCSGSPPTVRAVDDTAMLITCEHGVFRWDAAEGEHAVPQRVEGVAVAPHWREMQPRRWDRYIVQAVSEQPPGTARLHVFDEATGAMIASQEFPLAAIQRIVMVSERKALFLESDGRLVSLDIFTGQRESLPYALEVPHHSLGLVR
jgi:DNA-binding CsgD family transcriptional regulator